MYSYENVAYNMRHRSALCTLVESIYAISQWKKCHSAIALAVVQIISLILWISRKTYPIIFQLSNFKNFQTSWNTISQFLSSCRNTVWQTLTLVSLEFVCGLKWSISNNVPPSPCQFLLPVNNKVAFAARMLIQGDFLPPSTKILNQLKCKSYLKNKTQSFSRTASVYSQNRFH